MKKIMTLVVVCVLLGTTAVFAQTKINALPYTITSSGSYVVGSDLASTGDGITVSANDVTIDLNGHVITGGGVGVGIQLGSSSNVEVRNGTVRTFGHGIRGSNASAIRIINIRVTGNGGHGIRIDNYSYGILVKDCTASNNTGYGIFAGYGALITGNVANNNGGSWGIYGDVGSTISYNTSYRNGSRGIEGYDGSTIIGNTAYENGQAGIRAYTGSTVKNNTTSLNQEEGIWLAGNNLVDGNTAYGNNMSDGGYPNMSPCLTCTFGTNHAP